MELSGVSSARFGASVRVFYKVRDNDQANATVNDAFAQVRETHPELSALESSPLEAGSQGQLIAGVPGLVCRAAWVPSEETAKQAADLLRQKAGYPVLWSRTNDLSQSQKASLDAVSRDTRKVKALMALADNTDNENLTVALAKILQPDS